MQACIRSTGTTSEEEVRAVDGVGQSHLSYLLSFLFLFATVFSFNFCFRSRTKISELRVLAPRSFLRRAMSLIALTRNLTLIAQGDRP